MPAQVKLLGPDLGNPLIVDVDPTDTVASLKEAALRSWPSGLDPVLASQIRIIYQGRFLEDNKALKEVKVAEGEVTAMHLIIKSVTAVADAAPSGSDDKAPKCSCVVS